MNENHQKILIIVLIIFATIGISFLLETFVVFPSYSSLNQDQQQLSMEKDRADKITGVVNGLNSLDKNKVAQIRAFIDTLLPEQFDSFHFASLNEVVAAAASAQITSVTITKGAGGTKTTVGVGQTNQKAPSIINVAYSSDFDTILRLIKYWLVADRLVGPTNISISGQAGSSTLTYTIGYQLPLAPITDSATVDDNLVLTKDQISKLESLKSMVVYTATPSSNPIGKGNPFQ